MPKPPTRRHLHGDPVESRPGFYYCSRCDFFEPKEHFEACMLRAVHVYKGVYLQTHEHRYVLERRRAFRTSAKPRIVIGSTVMVDDMGNLFRTGTVKEQHLPKLERLRNNTTRYGWNAR